MIATRIALTPANVSRLHRTPQQAVNQPPGSVSFAANASTGLIQNRLFDASLIAYDDSYCTTCSAPNSRDHIPTLTYWGRLIPFINPLSRIVDIGCGQGEFVLALRARGYDAIGCDPVLREERSPHLVRRVWDEDVSGDLFVMRCVLPHLPDPIGFLERLRSANPHALVLIEYQRLEWTLRNSTWAQICHDHVNLFLESDFRSRYSVPASGRFGDGEWGWVLMDLSTDPSQAPSSLTKHRRWDAKDLVRRIDLLLAQRTEFCSGLVDAGPIYLWGAAGKGSVAAHALQSAGADVRGAIDLDVRRHGLHLEGSGVKVRGPEFLTQDHRGCRLLVCNPCHVRDVEEMTSNLPLRPQMLGTQRSCTRPA